MEAPNAALRLEKSFYDKVVVEAVPEYQQEDGLLLSGDIGVELLPPDTSSRPWVVVLSVGVTSPGDGPKPPYIVDVRVIGHFRWTGDEEDAEDADLESIIAVNGASLLYSGLRELIAVITARGPWAQLLLPTLDFRSIPVATGTLEEPEETADDSAD